MLSRFCKLSAFWGLLILFFLFPPTASAETSGIPAEAPYRTTVMIYMCGSDLESNFGSATKDISEMLVSGFDPEYTHVILMAGGSRKWNTGFDPSVTSIVELRGKGQRTVWKSENPLNMAEPATLETLLDYGFQHYPADRYGLIIWDHGGGPNEGTCYDELFGWNTLSLPALGNALRTSLDNHPLQGSGKLDWIGFDACLMSSVEVALSVSPYAEYMIASQETEPSTGWNYAFLNGLEWDADAAGTGRRIVDAYFEDHGTDSYGLTLSCLDLSAVHSVSDCMSDFFEPIGSEMNSETFAAISGLRMTSADFGRAVRGKNDSDFDLVDLADLAEHCADFGDPTALRDALRRTVVYSRPSADGKNGLSVYHPLYNKDAWLASWKDCYSELGFSAGYQSYLNAFGTILTGGALAADWADLLLTDDGFDADQNNLFHLLLSDTQTVNFANAQLIILGSLTSAYGTEGTGTYDMQLTEAGAQTQWSTCYYPVWNSGLLRQDGDLLSFRFGGQSLYLTDTAGHAVAGPLGYQLSDDGEEWYIHAVYRDNSGRENPVPDADVIYTCLTDETGAALSVVQVQVFDNATGTYTSRAAFSESDYTEVSFSRLSRTLPEDQAPLPGLESWPEFAGGITLPLPLDWELRIIDEQLSGTPLYATVQVTDVQQNSYCTPLIRVRNPNLSAIGISPRTFSGEDFDLTLYAVMDRSQLSPGLSLSMEITNRSDYLTTYSVSGFLLNGSRTAMDDGGYGMRSSAAPGETGFDSCHISLEQLTGLAEITEVDFTLGVWRKVSDSPPRYDDLKIPLHFDLTGCQAVGSASPGKSLSEPVGSGDLVWQLVSLKETPQGSLRGVLHVENNGAGAVTGLGSITVNNSFQTDDSFRIFLLPKTDLYLPFTIRDHFSLPVPGGLEVQGRSSWYYLGVDHLLERFGISEVKQLNLFFDFYNRTDSVSLTLNAPFRLRTADPGAPARQADMPDPLDLPLLLDGDVTVGVDQLLVGDNGVVLRLVMRNRTDRDLTLTLAHTQMLKDKICGLAKDCYLGAHSTMLTGACLLPEGARAGDVFHEIGMTFRYDDFTTTRARICFREPLTLGDYRERYLNPGDFTTVPAMHPGVQDTEELLPLNAAQSGEGDGRVLLSLRLTNEEDEFLAPEDYFDDPRHLELSLSLPDAEERTYYSFGHFVLNGHHLVSGDARLDSLSHRAELSVSWPELTDLNELCSVSCVMTAFPFGKPKEAREIPLCWEFDSLEFGGSAPVSAAPLAETESDGLIWKLLSVRTNPDDWTWTGNLDMQLAVFNETGETVNLGKLSMMAEGLTEEVRTAAYAPVMDPDTEQYIQVSFSNSAKYDRSYFMVNGSSVNELYRGQVLQCSGISTVHSVTLVCDSAEGEETVSRIAALDLREAFPLPRPGSTEAGNYAARKPLLQGEVAAELSDLMVGDKNLALTFTLRNDSDTVRTVTLSDAEASGLPLLFGEFGSDEEKTVRLNPHSFRVQSLVLTPSDESLPETPLGDLTICLAVDNGESEAFTIRSGIPLILGNGRYADADHLELLSGEVSAWKAPNYPCSAVWVKLNMNSGDWSVVSGKPRADELDWDEAYEPALRLENYSSGSISPTVTARINGEWYSWPAYEVDGNTWFCYFSMGAYSGPGSYDCTFYVDGAEVCSDTLAVD